MIGFLAERWNAIVDAIVGGTTYTIQFFQMIGYAVAGALGLVFLTPLRFIVELSLTFGWLIKNIINLISILILPINYIAIILSHLIAGLIVTTTPTNLFSVNNPMLNLFNQIPYWNILTGIIGSLIIFVGIMATIKNAKL